MNGTISNAKGGKPRILLVDDEAVILQTLSILLKIEGYDPVPITDSGKARDMLGVEPFDLMITDLRMPVCDGMELLKTAHDRVAKMPTILLTAYGSNEISRDALGYGAVAVLGKPFRPDEIFTAVRKGLGRSPTN